MPKRAASSSHEQPPAKVPTVRPFASQQLAPFHAQDLATVEHEGVVVIDSCSAGGPSVLHTMTLERVSLDNSREWSLVFDGGMAAVVCDATCPRCSWRTGFVACSCRLRQTAWLCRKEGLRRGISDGGACRRK